MADNFAPPCDDHALVMVQSAATALRESLRVRGVRVPPVLHVDNDWESPVVESGFHAVVYLSADCPRFVMVRTIGGQLFTVVPSLDESAGDDDTWFIHTVYDVEVELSNADVELHLRVDAALAERLEALGFTCRGVEEWAHGDDVTGIAARFVCAASCAEQAAATLAPLTELSVVEVVAECSRAPGGEAMRGSSCPVMPPRGMFGFVEVPGSRGVVRLVGPDGDLAGTRYRDGSWVVFSREGGVAANGHRDDIEEGLAVLLAVGRALWS